LCRYYEKPRFQEGRNSSQSLRCHAIDGTSRGFMSVDLEKACALLRKNELVAFPTETVYGLGANALEPQAVLKIFETKGRPQFDPLIVHAKDAETAFALAAEVPDVARQLAAHFWPGPLTLVLNKRDVVPDLVTSGMQTVALRVPAHPLSLALLRAFDGYLAAPSANRFGRISPTTAEHVRREFGAELSLVLDGGPCMTGVESTIISLASEVPTLLRPGGTPMEELRQLLPNLSFPGSDPAHPMAPGQLPSHYAPRTQLVLADVKSQGQLLASSRDKKLGLIYVGPARPTPGFACVEVLSTDGDMREAASGLFAAMRRLDEASLDLIVAEPTTDTGLGLAINDRLRRASHR
jgi:L-threonylcarbamoyladenylate synthase